MTFTHYVYGNPLHPLVPMEIWLLIRKFKEELEFEEKIKKIRRLDRLVVHYRFLWRSPYSTKEARRRAKYDYYSACEERAAIIKQ